MNNRYARILAAGAPAVLAATLGTQAALAAGTWTIQPGGRIQAASGLSAAADPRTGTDLRCVSSSATGTLTRGSGLLGVHVGSLSAVSFADCSSPVIFRLQAGGLPWHVNLSSYNAATDVARGTLSHLRLTMSGSGCTATLDGTSATADDGRVAFRYTDGTGRLKVLTTAGNLHFYDVSKGCLGIVNDGDPATLSGTYTVTPEQAITSP
jgi:hypothetical protein